MWSYSKVLPAIFHHTLLAVILFNIFCGLVVQLKPGQPVPSPSELMGKILIKNKKSSAPPSKPEQVKKASAPEQANGPADDSDPAPANPETSEPPHAAGQFIH